MFIGSGTWGIPTESAGDGGQAEGQREEFQCLAEERRVFPAVGGTASKMLRGTHSDLHLM